MEREIGGYFGLEQFTGKPYHDRLTAVNSGRNALLYIIRARNIKKLYIPRFLCDTVWKLCLREGIAYEEYGIDGSFSPLFDRELDEGEWLYVVNYYGQITDAQVMEWKAKYGRVILDNVQDFFRKPLPDVDTVYSCRKFFGVPDGGYAACSGKVPLEKDASRSRMVHLLGRYETSGSEYYGDFQSNDEKFYELPLLEMSPITCNILRAVDYEEVRQKRNRNYDILAQTLNTKNRLTLRSPDGPYCYPFYCENGMAVKRALAQKKIYVPTLWPNVLEQGSVLEKDYAENILPLPVDQRYGEEDMNRVLEELYICMKI